MASVGANLKFGLGGMAPGNMGAGQNPTRQAMGYPAFGAGNGNGAPAHVITGELLALVVLELIILGMIRVSFKHHFGG
jgi:hypothetical protein